MPRKSPSFSASASSEFRNEVFDMQQFRNLQDKVFVDGAIWFYLFSLRIYRSTSNLCEHESPHRPRQCKGYHRAGIIVRSILHNGYTKDICCSCSRCFLYACFLRLATWRCSPKMFYRLLLSLHKLPAFCNHLSAAVFSEEADVCLRARGRDQLRQPFVSIVLCHNPLPIEPVEPLVRLPSQGTQFSVGKTADRNRRPFMHPHIGVTGRVSGADIQHHPARVLPIDSVR